MKSCRKWRANEAIGEAEAIIKIKEIMDAVQTGRAGLGQTPHCWLSHQDTKGAREMVLEEVLELEEEKHQIAAAGFSKQCAWTKWEQVEQR